MKVAGTEYPDKPSHGCDQGRTPADLKVLYGQQERRIYRLCLAYLKNTSDAEDATQETFVRAARRLDQLTGDPCAYLTAVARNVCCDDLRRRARASDATRRGLHLPDAPGDAESAVLTRTTLRRVWMKLHRHEREMLLDSFAGYSYDEISRRSGLSVPAVASIISRARQHARHAAEVTASAVFPLALFRRLHRRFTRLTARSAASGGDAATVGAQPGALLVGSVVTCLMAGAVGSIALAGPTGGQLHDGRGIVPRAASARVDVSTDAMSSLRDRGTDGFAPGGAGVAGSGGDGTSRGAHAPLDIVSEVVAPPPAQQQDTAFVDVEPSPHYAQDGTLFASGTVVRGCTRATCPVLFRSTDRGTTWSQVESSGFTGGQLLLPPAFPADPTMFAMSATGLARSNDAGRSFVPVTPISAPAAVVPDSPAGDARVLIGTDPPTVYSARSGAITPGPLLPPGITELDDVAFAGGSGHLVVTGMRVDPAGIGYQDAVVVDCAHACGSILAAPHEGALHLSVSPDFPTDGTYFAYSSQHVYVSRDGGQTIAALAVSLSGSVSTFALSPRYGQDGRAVLSTYTLDAALQPRPAVAVSHDAARDFASTAASGLPASYMVSSLSMTDDNRMFATLSGPDSTGLFGIRCSIDGGYVWRLSC